MILRSLFIIPLFFFLFSCNQPKQDKIIVAAAANTRFALEEITIAFEKEYHIPVETVISSSGKLTAQILQGAPYDVFMSANMKYPITLF